MAKLKLSLNILAIVGGVTSLNGVASAQSPYELRLGMHKSVVTRILDGEIGTLNRDMSDEREEWFRSPSFDLVFCKEKLTAFRIRLKSGVSAWANAVETAKLERGDPQISWRGSVSGEVKAVWRTAPYQQLTISMLQFNDEKIEVSRWMEDSRKCEIPLSL